MDYIPNDILWGCLFPPDIHIIHTVRTGEAVTDQEILK